MMAARVERVAAWKVWGNLVKGDKLSVGKGKLRLLLYHSGSIFLTHAE